MAACRGFACSIAARSSCTPGSPWRKVVYWLGSPRVRMRYWNQAPYCFWPRTPYPVCPAEVLASRQGLQLQLGSGNSFVFVPGFTQTGAWWTAPRHSPANDSSACTHTSRCCGQIPPACRTTAPTLRMWLPTAHLPVMS